MSMDRTCAVVVTHNPDITALLKLLARLDRETDFIVVDNGSAIMDSLAESVTALRRCRELVRLERNEGLARALNVGTEHARRLGCDYVFFFDQDSAPCNMFVARMIGACREAAARSDRGVAAVGPRIFNPQTMRQMPFKLFNRLLLRSDRPFAGMASHYRADFLITSGTLLVLRHLDEIGPMREDYFIDNIDLEWCFRARAKGFDLVGTDDAVLYHAIGERSDNPLVKAGIMAQHNPARAYYSCRNRTHLYSVDYSPIGWKVRDRARFFIKALWLIVSSPERRQYWRSIRSGIRDAVTLN